MKKALLFTSKQIGRTNSVNYRYILQDRSIDPFPDYAVECSGPWGLLDTTDDENVLYFNLFKNPQGLVVAGPIYLNDAKQNEEIVESLPEYFTMLCTSDVAEAAKKALGDKMTINILFSEQTLLTSS